MSKIKICGLKRIEDIHAVNLAAPDYIGFVFAPGKRQIDENLASRLKAVLNPGIKVVGVFVNEDKERILSLCKKKVIDLIQLHGDEDDAEILKIQEQVPNKIIRAVRVSSKEDVIKSQEYICDYLLFDTFTKGSYGGSGITFPWSYLNNIEKPYFLAGGLNQSNIAKAVEQYRPFCADVSSGAETDGLKDEKKIAEIVRLVRSVS